MAEFVLETPTRNGFDYVVRRRLYLSELIAPAQPLEHVHLAAIHHSAETEAEAEAVGRL